MTGAEGVRAELRGAAIARFRSVYEPDEPTDWNAEEQRLDVVGFGAARDIATAAIAEIRALAERLAQAEQRADEAEAELAEDTVAMPATAPRAAPAGRGVEPHPARDVGQDHRRDRRHDRAHRRRRRGVRRRSSRGRHR